MNRLFFSVAVAVCLFTLDVFASQVPVDIPARARGAERVVVGTIVSVQSAFEKNAFGDELIISHTLVEIDQNLKGTSATPFVDVDIEGGTVGTVTLKVSDLPTVQRGERAVFFLDRRGSSTVHVPHLRGLGILKLDADDVVPGSSLTLDQIRTMVRGAAAR
jgi:hypothetical protein